MGGAGDQEKVDNRIRDISLIIAEEKSAQIKGIHRDRLTRLSAKVAEIGVGGGTDSERGEIRDLIIDSLNSAKSAI